VDPFDGAGIVVVAQAGGLKRQIPLHGHRIRADVVVQDHPVGHNAVARPGRVQAQHLLPEAGQHLVALVVEQHSDPLLCLVEVAPLLHQPVISQLRSSLDRISQRRDHARRGDDLAVCPQKLAQCSQILV
jgi:hypothetical protein